jgi:hypothetical protein
MLVDESLNPLSRELDRPLTNLKELNLRARRAAFRPSNKLAQTTGLHPQQVGRLGEYQQAIFGTRIYQIGN